MSGGIKLPSLKPPTALAVKESLLNTIDQQIKEEEEEVKSNQTSGASVDLLTDKEKRELLQAKPPKKKKPGKDTIRKKPPHPESIMGKAYACYNKYHDRYVALVNTFDREFTQLAREEAAERERLLALQVTPPSTIASPRIAATVDDVIDLCKSRIQLGKVKRLRKLVKDNFIDVNEKSKLYGGWTPAIAAARAGSTKTLAVLVEEFGADVNITEDHNWSPLMFAAYRGHVKTVQYLVVVARADRSIECNGRGWNAQMYARSKAFPSSLTKKRENERKTRKYNRTAEYTVDQLQHQKIINILKGDTPYHTPRVLDYDAELNFRSLLFQRKRNLEIAEEEIAAINCWCMNLETRCKKCQYKINNHNNAKDDEERAAFLKKKQDEIDRKKRWVAERRGFHSDSSDVSSSSSESSDSSSDENEDEKGDENIVHSKK
jgi:hypothetical protein